MRNYHECVINMNFSLFCNSFSIFLVMFYMVYIVSVDFPGMFYVRAAIESIPPNTTRIWYHCGPIFWANDPRGGLLGLMVHDFIEEAAEEFPITPVYKQFSVPSLFFVGVVKCFPNSRSMATKQQCFQCLDYMVNDILFELCESKQIPRSASYLVRDCYIRYTTTNEDNPTQCYPIPEM